MMVPFDKNPHMYSTIPINPNKKDRDILNAVDIFILSSNAVNAVVIIMTIELSPILNRAYFDIRIPNKMFVNNKQHPMMIVFFMILDVYRGWRCL